MIQIESVLESGFRSDCKLFLTCKSFQSTRSERFLEPVIKLFQHCRRQLKIHGLRRFMKTNFAPGFTKFISRFRTKVLARTTNCWSLCRTNYSLFSCGFPNQYSDVANQFFFFVFNHTHQQQQQQQFKFFSVEQTLQSQCSHCSDTVRSLYTSQMNSYKAARPNSDH